MLTYLKYLSFLLVGSGLMFNSMTQMEHTEAISKNGFSGQIRYAILYESKNPFITVKELEQKYGTEATLYLQNNNYKIVYNGSYTKSLLYIGKESMQLVSFLEYDTLISKNSLKNNADLNRMSFRNSETIILGRKCKELSLENDCGVIRYYYDPKIKCKEFKSKCHYLNIFNSYFRYAKAPFLKLEYDGPEFKRTMIAVEIQRTTLDENIFKDAKIMAFIKKP